MERLLVPMLVCLLVLLGNISGPVQSLEIIDHVSTEHAPIEHDHHHSDHHHHHQDETEKEPTSQDHHHDADLASLSVHPAILTPTASAMANSSQIHRDVVYLLTNQLSLLSFTPNIFRPPIS